MLRLIASLVLCVFVFTVIFTGTLLINNNCEEIDKQLVVFTSNIEQEDWEKANIETKKAMTYWEDKEKIMSVFIKGDVLDNISICYYELAAAVSLNNKNLSLIKCSELKGLINEIKEKEKFSIMSFF